MQKIRKKRIIFRTAPGGTYGDVVHYQKHEYVNIMVGEFVVRLVAA